MEEAGAGHLCPTGKNVGVGKGWNRRTVCSDFGQETPKCSARAVAGQDAQNVILNPSPVRVGHTR